MSLIFITITHAPRRLVSYGPAGKIQRTDENFRARTRLNVIGVIIIRLHACVRRRLCIPRRFPWREIGQSRPTLIYLSFRTCLLLARAVTSKCQIDGWMCAYVFSSSQLRRRLDDDLSGLKHNLQPSRETISVCWPHASEPAASLR
jgi:hypothetical protein